MTHANSLDEHSTLIVRDFIASHWGQFVGFMRDYTHSPDEAEKLADEIYTKVGGEAE